MANLRIQLHGPPADVPIMVCEDTSATVLKGVQLQRDAHDMSQKQFTAGAELIIWPGEPQVTGNLQRQWFLCAVSSAFQCCLYCFTLFGMQVLTVDICT